MAVFYLLPPRPLLGRCFAGYLQGLFPGLDWPGASWSRLAEILEMAADGQEDVYLVHPEELPPGEDVRRALADGFGAEPGDEIIEVRPGLRPGDWHVRRWRMDAAEAA
jgi:hypothetical protein